jgi:hypothetical protein
MSTPTHSARHQHHIGSAAPTIAVRTDDITIARQRMRNLAPWNVMPLPAMHTAGGTPDIPLTPAERERNEQLALAVLAVQMWHANALGALRR